MKYIRGIANSTFIKSELGDKKIVVYDTDNLSRNIMFVKDIFGVDMTGVTWYESIGFINSSRYRPPVGIYFSDNLAVHFNGKYRAEVVWNNRYFLVGDSNKKDSIESSCAWLGDGLYALFKLGNNLILDCGIMYCITDSFEVYQVTKSRSGLGITFNTRKKIGQMRPKECSVSYFIRRYI